MSFLTFMLLCVIAALAVMTAFLFVALCERDDEESEE